MSRVKRGTIKNKKRKNVLALAKGYRFGRSKKEAAAKDAIKHAGTHAFAHRKDKKNENRKVWTIKINALAREEGISYSKLIDALKKKEVVLDRKILADLAENHPEVFKKVLATVK